MICRTERYSCVLPFGSREWNVCHSASRTLCLCGMGNGRLALVAAEEEGYQTSRARPILHGTCETLLNEVGKQLADLQISKGGNIIMVQVENEYGAFGIDKPYISEIRDMVKQAGFTGVPLFQCDWNSNFENNALDDLLWTINFGTGANIDEQFKRLKELRPDTPLMCSEFWSGWFDHWGAKHETRSAEELVKV